MPKPASNAPIYKGHFGGLSVSAWQYSLVIQKRKPKNPDEPKGEWYNDGEVKGVNKTQALELIKLLKAAVAEMSDPKPFKGKSNESDDDE